MIENTTSTDARARLDALYEESMELCDRHNSLPADHPERAEIRARLTAIHAETDEIRAGRGVGAAGGGAITNADELHAKIAELLIRSIEIQMQADAARARLAALGDPADPDVELVGFDWAGWTAVQERLISLRAWAAIVAAELRTAQQMIPLLGP